MASRYHIILLVAASLAAHAVAGADDWQLRAPMEAGVGRANQPAEWSIGDRAAADSRITLSFALHHTGLDELESTLYAVSDPDSPRYGKHLTRDQVNEMVAPRLEDVAVLRAWLTDAGVAREAVTVLPGNDWLEVDTTVSKAEDLLQATYHVYHRTTGETTLRCASYSLPAQVASAVAFVGPTIRFPAPLRASFRPRPAGPDALFVTPAFLHGLYQTHDTKNTVASNSQSAASFLGQFFSQSDLQEFYKLFLNTSLGEVPKVVGPNSGFPGTEASLDVQYITAQGNGVPTTMWSTAGNAPTNPNNEPFLAWITAVNALTDPPKVISVSYGDDEKSVGYGYASRINAEFMKAGAKGVSIIFAAGDSGTGGNCSASKGRFNPNFPVGSPYVTGVGGLIGGTAGAVPTGEVCDSISGGGISDFWDRPAYQKDAVAHYIANKTGLPDAWRWNHTGRAYPDVAAQSEGFIVVQDGIPLPGVGGTSCATPTVSGTIALLNNARLAAGKSTLGFLNPLLYKIGAAYKTTYLNVMNDVVEGYNIGCGPSGLGFPSRPGWDPATGWGSPNYAKLLPVVMALP